MLIMKREKVAQGEENLDSATLSREVKGKTYKNHQILDEEIVVSAGIQ